MYIKRDAEGRIEAVSRQPSDEFQESLPAGSPELVAFLDGGSGAELLSSTDIELVRVLEDLVDLLVDKDVIHFTDLPDAAQKKLLGRRTARDGMRQGLRLLDDEEGSGTL